MARRLGVTKQSVSKLELRSRSMGEDMMKRYADALGCVVVVTLKEKTCE
jgi:transcriptional regulator with XRE-family HTH domain